MFGFNSALDHDLARLGPNVILPDGLYTRTRKSRSGTTTLITAREEEQPLRRLVGLEHFNDHVAHRNGSAVRRFLQDEVETARARISDQALRHFVDFLLPTFLERDCSRVSMSDWDSDFDFPFASDDPSGVIDGLAREVPRMRLPVPSVVMSDRLIVLRSLDSPPMGLRVHHKGCHLGPTGEEPALADFLVRWQIEAQAWLDRTRDGLVQISEVPESKTSRLAREEVRRLGHYQRGDLFFLPGSPPAIGHVLPPHFNWTLRRDSIGDLAIVAALTFPARLGPPRVVVKDSQGRWVALHLTHGLCLGGVPPGGPSCPSGLTLMAYLRWAAIRAAGNGAFHANDLPNQSS